MIKNLSKLTILAVSAAFLSACVIHVGPGSYKNTGSSTDSVFGDVRVASGQTVGNVSSVNGSVLLSHRVTGKYISTVNGSIEVGDYNQVEELSTVNGDITAGRSLMSNGKVETVNGDITLSIDTVVKSEVSTVNGDIVLNSSKVSGNVETNTGDIRITGNSQIDGDIRFIRDHNDSDNVFSGKPGLTIAHNVSLKGEIYLEREVDLDIANPDIAKKVVYLFGKK